MIRTRGIAAACVMALAAVTLPATASAAEVDASASSPAREVRATIEGELLVAVAHGPGVEKTLVSVRTDEGATVPIDADTAPEALAQAASGAEVAVTVVVPQDVRAELRADGLSDAALAGDGAAEVVATALDDAQTPVVATSATVLSEDEPVGAPSDIAGGVAAGAAVKTHDAYVAIIDDAAASGDYTEAQARATLAAGAGYWRRESAGALADIAVKSVVTHQTANVCATLAQGGVQGVWEIIRSTYYPNQTFTTANASHLVVFVPRGCFDSKQIGWTGMARINKDLGSGGEVMLALGDDHTVAHELGHNFGLGHSDIVRSGNPRFDGYRGVHSVQGIAMFRDESYTSTFATPSLDVAYEWLLETVPAGTIASGRPGSVTTLNSVTASSGVKGVALASGDRTYFVEYRDGGGDDAGAFYNAAAPGWESIDASPGVRVYERDTHYGSRLQTLGMWRGNYWHSTITAGESLTTRDGKLTITAEAIGGGTATVRVTGASASKTSLSVAKATHGKKTKVKVKVTGAVRPLGGVTLYDGSKKIGAKSLALDGTATLYLPTSTKAGKHALKAVYSGSTALAGSSSTRTIKVAKAKVKAKIIKAKNLKAGKSARLTIQVTGTSATKPQGKIAVKVGSATVSKIVKLKKSKGRWIATVTTKKLPKGKVKVVYAPAKAASKNLAKTTVTTSKRAR